MGGGLFRDFPKSSRSLLQTCDMELSQGHTDKCRNYMTPNSVSWGCWESHAHQPTKEVHPRISARSVSRRDAATRPGTLSDVSLLAGSPALWSGPLHVSFMMKGHPGRSLEASPGLRSGFPACVWIAERKKIFGGYSENWCETGAMPRPTADGV